MEKKEIRNLVLQKLNENEKLNKVQINRIHQNLYVQELWENANVIGITISKDPEVSTIEIIEEAWKQGKTIVVPRCIPAERQLEFYIITDFNQTKCSSFGVLEPIPEICVEVMPNEIELLIVPGLAFNKKGYRIGFGGGYYDRFLVRYQGPTVAVAFDWQTKFDFYEEVHDKRVDRIITEIIE